MKHIIFVDSIRIEIFLFRCFIFENDRQEICFGIFLDDHTAPLIWFEREGDDTASLHTNDELTQLINTHTQSDKETRKRNFKSFLQFVKYSERIASKMVFKGRKVEYLSKSQDLSKIKKDYVNKVD